MCTATETAMRLIFNNHKLAQDLCLRALQMAHADQPLRDDIDLDREIPIDGIGPINVVIDRVDLESSQRALMLLQSGQVKFYVLGHGTVLAGLVGHVKGSAVLIMFVDLEDRLRMVFDSAAVMSDAR